MNQEQLKSIIHEKVVLLENLGADICNEFDLDKIVLFKSELKFLKNLINLVKLNVKNSNASMPDKCKKIYNIAGVIVEAQNHIKDISKTSTATQEQEKYQKVIDTAYREWQKTYEFGGFIKMEKIMLALEYHKVPPAAINNIMQQTQIA